MKRRDFFKSIPFISCLPFVKFEKNEMPKPKPLDFSKPIVYPFTGAVGNWARTSFSGHYNVSGSYWGKKI